MRGTLEFDGESPRAIPPPKAEFGERHAFKQQFMVPYNKKSPKGGKSYG